jgi:hypothetical protein
LQAVNGTSLNDKLLKVFVHTGYNKDAAAAMSAANAAKAKEKQQQAKQERVSNKKATATSTAGPDSAGDSNESSTKGDEIKPKRQQQRRAVTYDLKVQGLAWATTAEGLAQHFSDCKVGPGVFLVLKFQKEIFIFLKEKERLLISICFNKEFF